MSDVKNRKYGREEMAPCVDCVVDAVDDDRTPTVGWPFALRRVIVTHAQVLPLICNGD